jgi:hypothetical protein
MTTGTVSGLIFANTYSVYFREEGTAVEIKDEVVDESRRLKKQRV